MSGISWTAVEPALGLQPVCNRSFSISLEKVNKLEVVIVVQTLYTVFAR